MQNINEYKKQHKPQQGEKVKFYQGNYIPENLSKVVGGNIIYRSSWEYRLCRWCDLCPSVIRWGSECVKVEYRDRGSVDLNECRKYGLDPNDPAQWPIRDYFIDFYIEFGGKDWDGNPENIKRYLIEVKPYKETRIPERVPDTAKLKDKKRFVVDARKYATNRAKWDAAEAFAERNGMKFDVWTEHELKKLGIM